MSRKTPAKAPAAPDSNDFFQHTIAVVYDFDGTLSPQPMQEYTVLPKIGVEPIKFWKRVHDEARATESDPMLVYMRHIVEALEGEKLAVKNPATDAILGHVAVARKACAARVR